MVSPELSRRGKTLLDVLDFQDYLFCQLIVNITVFVKNMESEHSVLNGVKSEELWFFLNECFEEMHLLLLLFDGCSEHVAPIVSVHVVKLQSIVFPGQPYDPVLVVNDILLPGEVVLVE